MARLLDNWIDAYVELMDGTEPAKIFDTWTAYSMVSAALRRKVSLQLGRLTYHSNIYVVFVAEPGVARKTRAIMNGAAFLEKIPEIKLSSDSATKEALTDDIEEAKVPEVMPSGEDFTHSSLSIISKEFESFLGQKKENTRMLTALTDLFDCPSEWSSRTRHGKSNKIVRPWVNLLSATTPDSLASSLPASAVGGGLTSRMLFIWADKKKRSVAVPIMTARDLELKDKLEKDLFLISRIAGEYTMTSKCINNWTDWYNEYDEDESGERVCTDKSFGGWYSRKPTYILKIAMLNTAAMSDQLVIKWENVETAISAVREVEYTMGNAFKAIGKSEITSEVDTVFQIIKNGGTVSEKQIMSIVWRDIDNTKFDNVIETLIKTGKVVRLYIGPNKEKGIWYKFME